MSLQPGVRLGVFEILGPLGAGGMGEVYRARDTRLGREVAIKVLPAAFSGDPSRVARFEREARLLASINHPAIAAIYGAEQEGDVRYLAMELVPGETLESLLFRGPIPLEESLQICRQIADGLEAAHERGVVHRDLKPANIKVTPDGRVKILDLGLAKAMELPASDEGLSESPTRTLDQTRPGTILGTVEFMSPEQARGKDVDKRTDIWAFGCVLFEMLSGRRAFTGETASDILASILTKEPDWSALPPATPPRVRELLVHCLQKNANERLRDIGDARSGLEHPLEESGSELRSSPAPPRERRLPIVAVVGAAILLGVFLTWKFLRSPAAEGPPVLGTDRALVVLPSRDLSGTPGGQLVGDGLVEMLSVRLGEVPGIQVVTPTAAVAASDNQSDPFRAARSVGAQLAVRSAFMRNGDSLRITYTVWRVRDLRQVASGTVDGSASNIFAMQDRLAESVASGLRLTRPGKKTPTAPGLESASAQERYLQAIGNLQRYDKPASVDAAVGLLEALASEAPASGLVQSALARAYLYKFVNTRDRKWVDRSLGACARAEGANPELAEVGITRGELLRETGQAGPAVASFERAVAAQPSNYAARLGLAEALASAGRAADAEGAFKRAIALQPEYWGGYSKLAGFYYGAGQFDKAAEMFGRVTQLTPDNARAFSNLGAVYGMMGRLEDALQAYRQSLALAPTDGAWSNVGTTDFYLGRYAEAADAFQKAIAITPGHFLFWANLGDAQRWTKKLANRAPDTYRRAIDLARQELGVNSRNARAHVYLALCLSKLGRDGEAEEQAREALSLEPSNPELLFGAGVVSLLGGRRADAIDRLRRSVAAGFPRTLVERDPELAPLRSEPSFQRLFRGPPEKAI